MCEKITNVPALFGQMVFGEQQMQQRLPTDIYQKWQQCLAQGTPLDRSTAGEIANAMKDWALEKGATHYTHWFQPMTGFTAEKHDSFITRDGKDGVVMELSAKELSKGEADASSFPSGGLRATFEARGYTVWDPTSFAFIKDEVLCIPTAFSSFTGEALDEKTPLLRSMAAVEVQAKRVLALFGEHPRRVIPTVGLEQEYFLISEKDFARRLDLALCDRTLFGADPCKGQEMEEHYFGAIRPTVNEFMKELDTELWELGIPARTKHNEVAPAQHELAPIFENANRAIDHNLLTMEKMKLLASHHGLVCLLHEKPFDGVNGSGKHDNWSLAADGKNLLEPGESPIENLRFLVFLSCIIEAVDEYQELLRSSVASASNDHRLGANEAPPAIVSIFLGTELSAIVEALVNDHETEYTSAHKVAMDLGVETLPNFLKDNTDRNRTSPFAFTGNKFEFRMPGSAENLSEANTILDTAMAKSLKDFANAMRDVPEEAFEERAIEYVKQLLRDHKRIIFDGNGYSDEWPIEAERRGLSNKATTADAMPCMVEPKNLKLFDEFGILSEVEVRSRYEVKLEKYNKLINIEINTMDRMVSRDYLPAINAFATKVARGITAVRAVSPLLDVSDQENLLKRLTDGVAAINKNLREVNAAHAAALQIEDQQERANEYAHNIIPMMDRLRASVDDMELIVGATYWPVPSYNRMLFYA